MTEAKTIYWAALLTPESKDLLLKNVPPIHGKVYAEHATIAFKPSEQIDEEFNKSLGKSVSLTVIGLASDDKGQAVEVKGVSRSDFGTPHITISCAGGTSPFYSNQLLQSNIEILDSFQLIATISKYTDQGWVK